MDDSTRPEVLALLGGGVLRAGLGCYGAGGVGPTRVWYLLWAGATKEEPSASAAVEPWIAIGTGEVVAAVAGELGPAAELGPTATGVEVSAGGVEPWRTAAGRNEPLESSSLTGLKESKLERRREVQKLEG